MRALIHNIGPGPADRGPRPSVRENIEQLIEDTSEPKIVSLQEASEFHGTVKNYTRVAPIGSPDDENCVILVRNDLRIERLHMVDVDGPDWVGPKHGKVHPPHIFPGVTVFDGSPSGHDQYWVFLNVHRLSNRDRNPEACRHEMQALTEWALRRPRHRPLVMNGDWNGRHTDPDLKQFAVQADLDFNLHGIDGAMTRNVEVLKLNKLSKLYGSDVHEPVLLTMKAT